MRSGHCPKCNNITVYKAIKGIGFGGGDSIYVNTRAVTYPKATEDYVCTTCGYFERYITDRKTLDEVAQKWEKVG